MSEASTEFGRRSENGEWRPPYPPKSNPLFEWPIKPFEVLRYVFGWPGMLWPRELVYFGLAAATWVITRNYIDEFVQIRAGWVALFFAKNFALMWIVYGTYHLVLYVKKLHGAHRKYHPKWQQKGSKKFLFKNQVLDNMYRTLGSGCLIWTAYEVLYFHLLSTGRLPMLEWATNPVWFVVWFPLIPMWRLFHFYLIHKLIHWRPLMRTVHYVHHKNPNPGPWSGMAMHPVEHLLYLSVVLIHFVIPSHPLHFLMNAQLTALTPAQSHHGFEGPLFGWWTSGSYYHYLHHRYVSCNFGDGIVPMDRWFGRYYDGLGTYRTKPNDAFGEDPEGSS